MEVKLRDSSSIKYENVSFLNNPLGNCCTTIGCKVYLKKKQMEVLANNPIVSIVCLGLTTTFSSKKQKDQQKIVACLIDKR